MCNVVSCNEVHYVVVVIAGPVISFCHKELILGTAIWFPGSLVIVVACYRVVQRVTVKLKRLELYLFYDCVFANASFHCYSQCV